MNTPRNKIIVAAVVAVMLVLAVTFIIHNNAPSIPSAPSNASGTTTANTTSTALSLNTTTPSAALATSSQEEIDTKLSLGPSTTNSTQPATSKPSQTTNPSAVAGCSLQLAFDQTTGNAASVGTMQYALMAKNVGAATCQSASISVYYANSETFSSASPAATADGYYWQLGDLASGQMVTISLTTNRNAPIETDAGDNACLSATNGADACTNAATGQTLATGGSSGSAPAGATGNSQSQAQVSTVAATTLAPQPGKELGVWVWTSISSMSPTEMQQIVDEAATNHFNVIYVTVDESLSITASGPAALSNYEQSVSEFISLAEQKNIAVDAEAGSRDWGQAGNTSEAPGIISFVANYNATHTAKFRGVQFDIEPYLLPTYTTNESGVLTSFVTLVDQLQIQAAAANIPLTIVLPHFFDQVIRWTPTITVDGVTDYTYNQVLRILNRSSGNRIIIMAYRNMALGGDGAIALSQTEVTDADTTNVRVIVAQETGPVTPSYVTFNGLTRSDLATQAATISSAFASDASFDGIAIDYLDPFLQLGG